jgi:hypothetical protein
MTIIFWNPCNIIKFDVFRFSLNSSGTACTITVTRVLATDFLVALPLLI